MAYETLQLAAYLPHSRANGPGLRSVLWMQGCPLRCPGCFNPEFWPVAGGTQYTVTKLAAKILAEADTEGVSFSGGEPFSQAAPLAQLAAQLQNAGKGILIFTGFTSVALRQKADLGVQRLLAVTDLLVAGPYEQQRPCQHSLLASANQELVHLSARYHGCEQEPRRAEYRIDNTGVVTITGFPTAISKGKPL